MRRRPEDIVAAVNGLVVLLLPVLLAMLVAAFHPAMNDFSVTVRPERTLLDRTLRNVSGAVVLAMFAAPGAIVAGWRSWVHARRSIERGRYIWRGVVEAGAFGFTATGLLMARACMTTAIESPVRFGPGIYAGATLVYGTLVLLPALAIGLLLQVTGMVALRCSLGARLSSRTG